MAQTSETWTRNRIHESIHQNIYHRTICKISYTTCEIEFMSCNRPIYIIMCHQIQKASSKSNWTDIKREADITDFSMLSIKPNWIILLWSDQNVNLVLVIRNVHQSDSLRYTSVNKMKEYTFILTYNRLKWPHTADGLRLQVNLTGKFNKEKESISVLGGL